ncbi:tetratricopeptide repeat protein [Polaribacter gochangensis]|uniref:tetratricopeptide repeat protein n=1 Tax=Polaribacter gochangensis TaxID=3252903 RepID=UPI003904D442
MKLSVTSFFLLLFLWNPIAGFSQDSIPISPNLKEENFLKFQDHFFKALAQKAIYNYRVAIENLEKCNELKPNDISVLFELSKNYLMMKRFLEAEQYALQALKIEPKNYWVLEHLGKIYLASSNIKSAIVIQEKIVKINPKGREKLVYLYFQNNQLEKAKILLNDLEKTNQLTPGLIHLRKEFVKSTVATKIEKVKGLPEFIKEFESDKSFEALYKILTLSANTNTNVLLSYSQIGLELFPAQAFVYLMNAKALNQSNNFEKAIEQLSNGIDFVIDDHNLEADFYEELAISYGKLGNKKEAIKNKNKALALRKKEEQK